MNGFSECQNEANKLFYLIFLAYPILLRKKHSALHTRLTFKNLLQSPIQCLLLSDITLCLYDLKHGLRTPNEGTNQRNLKNWADVADKICFGRT